MKEEIKYEPIEVIKYKRTLLEKLFLLDKLFGEYFGSDFNPDEVNYLITNLSEKIKNYSERDIVIGYNKKISNQGILISRAKIFSQDNIIKGQIYYEPSFPVGITIPNYENAKIKAIFNFNSNDPSLKDEYQGLAKIIKKI